MSRCIRVLLAWIALIQLGRAQDPPPFTIGGGLDPDDPNVASQFAEPFEALVEAEYFIGADPGEGLGDGSVTLSSPNDLASAFDNLSLPADLPVGTYDVGVRVKDADNRWSNPLIRRFTVKSFTIAGGVDSEDPDAANQFPKTYEALEQAEYFVGADPGEGNGTAISLEARDELSKAFDSITVPVDLPVGTYDVGVRVKDEAGRWSNPLIRRFTVKSFTIAGGVDSEDPDAANQFPKTYEVLEQAEFFVGADPGEGNGTAISLEASDEISKAFDNVTIPVDLPAGTYDVGVRVKDEAGRWSNPLIRRFTVASFTIAGGLDPSDPDIATSFAKPIEPLVQAEFYIGADPGEGNATAMSLPAGGEVSKALEDRLIALTMPPGTYDVGVRVKDEAGRWSNPLIRRFNYYRQDVVAVQRPGTKLVDIGYDIVRSSRPFTVTVLISRDGGQTWDIPNGSLTGDIGNAVISGPGKQIVWHAGEDWDDGFSEDMRFRVIAYETAQDVPSGFVGVGPGTFTMGSPAAEIGRASEEIERTVTMGRPFFMAVNEVTWTAWNAVRNQGANFGYDDIPAGQNGMNGDGSGNHPVTNLSWIDAVKWCNLKSEIEGRRPVYYSSPSFVDENVVRTGIPEIHVYGNANGYRLPSEAEWEYAARAGATSAFDNGDIIDAVTDPNLDLVGWYASNSGANTHTVGGKAVSAFGLRDMHGNVQEWCWDAYVPYAAGPQWDPLGGESAIRVLRGGSWMLPAADCRAAARQGSGRNSRGTDIGFRLALNYAGSVMMENETGSVVDSRDPAAGNLIGGMRPDVTGEIRCTAVQADGKIIIGGDFTAVDGVPRDNIARLHPDSSLDETFDPGADSTVYAVAVQRDGRILVAGDFTNIAGTATGFLARVFADGLIDLSLDASPDDVVRSLLLQPDGKIVLGGEFTEVKNEDRDSLARLNSDGSLDIGFAPEFDGPVYALAFQDDDAKILAAGDFFDVSGEARDYLVRLEPGGAVDLDFDPAPDDIVTCLAVQNNRRILVGGRFTSIADASRDYLARLTPTGSIDTGFTPDPDGEVGTLVLQADRGILVGGGFTAIDGQPSARLARLSTTGVLDTAFQPDVNGTVKSAAILGDGRVLFAGSFTSIGGVARDGLAWIDNDPISEELEARDSSRVRWTRGDTAPEAYAVHFELSTDGGANWQPLGSAERSGTRWDLNGVNLPESGMLRASATISSGQANASSGVVKTTAPYSGVVPFPEIDVQLAGGSSIPDGGSVDAGIHTVASSTPMNFVISNTGYGDLTGLGITIDGLHATDFIVSELPVAPVPGPAGSTGFVIQFAPTDVGVRSAVLHIANNDEDEDPTYDINLSGIGVIAGDLDGSINPLPNGAITALAAQPDGKLIVAGNYTQIGGTVRNRVARLLSDGSVEGTSTFTGGSGANAAIYCAAVQGDGKILIGGEFTSFSSQLRNRLARLMPDGTIEVTATFNAGTGANGAVRGIAVQPDGGILIVGDFTEVNNKPRGRIARLLPGGAVEESESFDAEVGADGPIHCVAVQPDGKIIIGGAFTQVQGESRICLARLNGDGSLDTGFNPGANGVVEAVAIDAAGRIVIAGAFGQVAGLDRGRIARILPDGSVESIDTFDPGSGANDTVRTIALQTDGSLLVGGDFTQFNSQPRGGIARLFANGTLETTITFNAGTGANAPVRGIALRPNGSIAVAGDFTAINGTLRNHFAVLFNGLGGETLDAVDTNGLRWLRDGTAPEIDQVSFELSSDGGSSWSPLGDGTRVAGGWELTGLSLPSSAMLRAAGRSTGGAGNGSSGMVGQTASFINDPTLVTLPATDIGPNTATLHGTINPNGDASVYFEYGLTESFGQQTPAQMVSGGSVIGRQDLAAGLLGNSSYYFRIVAITTGGSYFGNTMTLLTAPEPPLVTTGNPTSISGTGATLVGSVNPLGRPTQVRFEYGATTQYSTLTPIQEIPAGDTPVDVFAPIAGLTADQIYHFRIVATSSGGEALGSDVSFRAATTSEATAPPAVTTGAPANLTTTSVTLNATVNPNGGFTNAFFEYGLTEAYGSVTPALGAGNSGVPVNLFSVVPGLQPGLEYHYRIVASNSLGTREGEDASFSTNFLPPVANTGSAESVSTTSTRIRGSVRANGAPTQVSFEVSADGGVTYNSFAATPAEVTGDTEVLVSTVLTDLRQGITYQYRTRAQSAGGTNFGSVGTFAIELLSGLVQVFPGPPLASDGEVNVTMSPPGINTGWRFVGEHEWRGSGVAATNLTAGEREIEFRPVPGYQKPGRELVLVETGVPVQMIDRSYYERVGDQPTGSLRVTLLPESLTLETVPLPERAQWQFVGEDQNTWRDSNFTEVNLYPGDYLIRFKSLEGRVEPTTLSIAVNDAETSYITGTYRLADAAVGSLPAVLSSETVTTSTDLPYAYVGQLRSDAGVGTGFVVKDRVVATAAHVVFDDGTLSYVTGLNWSFQRDKGSYEPTPQIPRGFYVFENYSSLRDPDITPGVIPGEGTPESQSRDAAALYFQESAGRGGYAGYLASDRAESEYLMSGDLKTLVGYPVDGITPPDQGRMHATSPADLSFAPVPGQSHTYTTSDITSAGGNSGGPLCVQLAGGNYYPAAIYLGGSDQTVVRSIDSEVIELFSRAETSANGGGNSTGGGIAIVRPGEPIDGFLGTGGLMLVNTNLSNAGWQIFNVDQPTQFRSGGSTVFVTTLQEIMIVFEEVPGFSRPPDTLVMVDPNLTITVDALYEPAESAYSDWSDQYLSGFPAALTLGTADPDFDQIVNLLEFAFNLQPHVGETTYLTAGSGTSGLPISSSTGGGENRRMRIEFIRRIGPTAAGLTYRAEFGASPTPATWDEGGEVSVTPIDENWERVIVEDQVEAGSTRRFGRVSVTAAE